MSEKKNLTSSIGVRLKSNKLLQFVELISVFLPAVIIVLIGLSVAGENPIIFQSFVWIANLVMIGVVWVGLRLRGQDWSHFGLSKKFISLRSLLISFLVFIGGLAGFMLGSVIMANITGIPESADLSGYNYIEGNLPMLIAALLAVFIASSFGEEVIYRGFLITRISEMGGNNKTWIRLAVLISSIVFGLIHFEWGPMGMVQTGFMGLAFGVAFLLTKRNLWTLIMAHFYMDAILMVQMYLGG